MAGFQLGGILGNKFLNPDAVANGELQKWTGGGDDGSSTTAADTFAAVTKEQWSNYVNTFVPIENKLIQYATDPTVVSTAMSTASQGVQDAYTAQQGATARQLKGLGTSLSPDEQAAQTRSAGLQEGLADVSAQNTARDLTTQRQQSILGSPVPTSGA